MAKVSREFRPDIQALRGLAVIAVIAFHSYPAIFPAGYLGVDLFFVISGYVITPLIADIFSLNGERELTRSTFSRLKNFYIRRYFRLAPAIGVVFIIFTPLIVIFGDISLPRRLASQLIFSLFFIGNVGAYKFAGDYFHPQVTNPFIHTWSLSLEEQIYVLLPAAIALTYFFSRKSFLRHRLRNTVLVLSIVSLSFTIFPSVLNRFYAHFFAVPSALAFYSPLTRFWQFGAGALLWLTLRNLKMKSTSKSLIDYLLIAIAFGLLFMPIQWPGISGQVISTTLGVFVIGRSAFTELPERLWKILCWIGDRSYSAYLVHLPILYLFQQTPGLITATGPIRFGFWLLSLTAILLISNQIYVRVEMKHRLRNSGETPARRSIWKLFLTFHLIPILVGCAVLAASSSNYFGLIGKATVTQEGQTFAKYCARENFIRQFPCTFPSQSNSKRLLLLGDSHAAQYSLDIWSVARQLGYSVTFDGDFGGPIDPSGVINFASRFKPDVIVVSKYWRSENGKLTPSVVSSLAKLATITRRFIVFGQNPVYLAADSPAHTQSLFTTILQGQKSDSPSGLHLKKLDSQAQLSGVLLSHFVQKSGWEFVDVTNLFCESGTCGTGDSNGSFYSDTNHLSAHGAFKIRKPLLELLAK